MCAPKMPVWVGIPSSRKNICEFFHERCGNFRRSRLGEGWPASLACVGIKGELGDHDSRPTHIQDGSIELALMIFENAQAGYFLGQEAGLFLGITLTNAKQDDQSVADFGDGSAIHGYFSGFDSLDERAHAGYENENEKLKGALV